MEIHPGIEINDDMTLGDLRAIKSEFKKPIDEIDWEGMDGDQAIRLVSCLVQSARKEPMEKTELDFLVRQIPMSKLPDVFKRLIVSMPKSSAEHTDGNLQEGNAPTQASKTSTVPSA